MITNDELKTLQDEIVSLKARVAMLEAQHRTYGPTIYGGPNSVYYPPVKIDVNSSDFGDGWDHPIAPCPCDNEKDW